MGRDRRAEGGHRQRRAPASLAWPARLRHHRTGRTLPETHRAPALFLFGWKAWRDGNGALASMAVDRALHADPDYSAASLLQAALTQGIDPRRMPRLRLTG